MSDDTGWNLIVRRMVHDLRTPLNTIIGFASLVRDGQAGAINERQQEFLEFVLSGARELEVIITTAQRDAENLARGADERGGQPSR